MPRIAISTASDWIDDQLLGDTVIVIKTVESLRIAFRTVGFQVGDGKLNEVPYCIIERTDIVGVPRSLCLARTRNIS